jgi:hypothetical protein
VTYHKFNDDFKSNINFEGKKIVIYNIILKIKEYIEQRESQPCCNNMKGRDRIVRVRYEIDI